MRLDLDAVCACLPCAWAFCLRRVFYTFAMVCVRCRSDCHLMGLGVRVVISGRAPVTNMYESVIFAGLGIGVLGLILANLDGASASAIMRRRALPRCC